MGLTGLEVASLYAAGARPRQLRVVLEAYSSLDAYLAADPAAKEALGAPTCTPTPLELPDGAWALALTDADYPDALRSAPSPPPVLFGLGDPSALALGVGVVGTREVSGLGAAVAALSVEAALRAGVPVHSGLAYGVDTVAHRAALDAGVRTCAVVASGIDSFTPSKNAPLARELLAAGGAVVSEQLPGTPPRGPYLQARNRIIAGLSSVVVCCEASLASGTMGTVRAALAMDRSVAVPAVKDAARSLPGAQAPLALADPLGCDPKLLGATGAAAAAVRARRPVADLVAPSDVFADRLAERLRLGLIARPATAPAPDPDLLF